MYTPGYRRSLGALDPGALGLDTSAVNVNPLPAVSLTDLLAAEAALPISSAGSDAYNAALAAPGGAVATMGAPNWWVLAAVAAGLVAFAMVRR